MIEPFILIVVIQETHKIFSSFPMRTDKRIFSRLTGSKNLSDHSHISKRFGYCRQIVKKGKIKSGIDTESISIRTISSYKLFDGFFIIIYFTKHEKIPFPYTHAIFTNGISECLYNYRSYIFNRVYPESINIKIGYQVGIYLNQDI